MGIPRLGMPGAMPGVIPGGGSRLRVTIQNFKKNTPPVPVGILIGRAGLANTIIGGCPGAVGTRNWPGMGKMGKPEGGGR